MKYADQDHTQKRLEQLLQDQLENRNPLPFTGTGPREGLSRTELPLQSQRDHVGLETLSSTDQSSSTDHSYKPMPVSAQSVLLPPSPSHHCPDSPAHRHNMDLDGDLIAHLGSECYSSKSVSGQYHCTFEGCKAAPFQTQYLLNSHSDTHTQDQLYRCPVKGCRVSESGTGGFRRKNHLIRHVRSLHEPPRYNCPFCPDNKRKFRRQEALQ